LFVVSNQLDLCLAQPSTIRGEDRVSSTSLAATSTTDQPNPTDQTGPEQSAREAASRDLMATLMGVKSWIRDAHKWLYSGHTPTTLMSLALLERCGPARVSALAEEARVDTSVVSRQLAQLEQHGLVERSPDPEDGRAHRVTLTEQGRQVLADGRDRLARMVTERLEGWDAGEIRGVVSGLQRLLDDLRDPAPPSSATS
jgi:DNA-binding MarR family transcriptional regulator